MGLDRARGLGGAPGGVSFSRGNRKHEYDEHETPISEGAEEWVSAPLSHFGFLGAEFWLLSCLGTGFRHPLTCFSATTPNKGAPYTILMQDRI